MKRAKVRNEERNGLTPVHFAANTNTSSSSIKENLNADNLKTPNDQQLKKITVPKAKMMFTISPPKNQSLKINQSLNRVTRSQPGSRSSSPSLRSAYLNDLSSPYSSDLSSCSGNRMKRSAIPIMSTRKSPHQDDCVEANSPLMTRSLRGNQMLIQKDLQSNSSSRKILTLDYQSDQSEVSSLCSDKSFGERKLEDINDIIKNLNSTHWPNKKDGLVSLEHFIFHSTVNLNEDQLKILTDIFTKMLLDPNTKALSLVLNILNTFIIHFHNELDFWLYILLTRLFLKTGSDLLSSIQKRVIKTFEVIADSFQKASQFNVVIQFLSDTKLTPVLKVKITALQYLLNLILQMDPADLNCKQNKKEYEQFLIKVIAWTEDKKSAQLRSLSQDIILELFNLNTPEFCNIVSQLPAGYWDTAYKYMKEKKVSNKKPVEDSVMFSQSFYEQILKFSFAKNEDLNQTAYFDSLMKTTEEINKFTSVLNDDEDSFKENKSKLSNNNHSTDLNHQSVKQKENLIDFDYQDDHSTYKTSEIESKKTSSMDSGISQIDCASTNYKTSTSTNDSSSAKLSPETRENVDNSSGSDLTTYNSFKSMNSFYVSTATSMKNDDSQNQENSISQQPTSDNEEMLNEINNNNYDKCLSSLDDLSSNKSIKFDKNKFEELLDRIEHHSNCDELVNLLEELNRFILNNDYKLDLMRFTDKLIQLFLHKIDNKELILRQLTIKTFSDFINEFSDSILDQQLQLILDKLLFLTKQDYKDLNSVIQHFTDIIACNFQIESCADYLVKIIDNGQYPSNEASIKLLTKVRQF